jgi:alpha 1,3-glucosidase
MHYLVPAQNQLNNKYQICLVDVCTLLVWFILSSRLSNFVILQYQVIALNSSGSAEGELYVDDGKSYDYQQGAFIHRRFVFADNKLTSINIAPDNLGKKVFSTECVIERIIVLGLSSGAKKAIIEPGNQEVEIDLGPISLRSGSRSVAPTVRRPNVRVVDDWTIRIA